MKQFQNLTSLSRQTSRSTTVMIDTWSMTYQSKISLESAWRCSERQLGGRRDEVGFGSATVSRACYGLEKLLPQDQMKYCEGPALQGWHLIELVWSATNKTKQRLDYRQVISLGPVSYASSGTSLCRDESYADGFLLSIRWSMRLQEIYIIVLFGLEDLKQSFISQSFSLSSRVQSGIWRRWEQK